MPVLDTFRGFVDSVQNEKAYITLATEAGDEFTGEISVDDMKRHGLSDQQAFKLRTVEVDADTVRLEWEPIQRRELTAEEGAEISRRAYEVCSGLDDFEA